METSFWLGDAEPTWEGEITIPRKEYEQLKEDSRILGKLYAGGVDNWEWYGECFDYDEEEED